MRPVVASGGSSNSSSRGSIVGLTESLGHLMQVVVESGEGVRGGWAVSMSSSSGTVPKT